MNVTPGWSVIVTYYTDVITVDVLDENDNLTEIRNFVDLDDALRQAQELMTGV